MFVIVYVLVAIVKLLVYPNQVRAQVAHVLR